MGRFHGAMEKAMQSTTPATTISSHLAVRPEWLDRRREEALEPDLPILDPHHQLIDRPESGRYLLPDLLDDIGGGGGHNVAPAAVTASRPSVPASSDMPTWRPARA
jgi:hypothetical protein